MLIRLEAMKAERPVRVLDAAETFEISKDTDEPDPDGSYSIVTDNGENGIKAAGTERALHDWLNRARNQLSYKTGGPLVMAVLDLSTHHLPEQICAELNGYDGGTAYDTRYGWLLSVPGNLTEHRGDHVDSVPDEVWRLWEYAHQYGATYILLDAEADRVDALPSWDW